MVLNETGASDQDRLADRFWNQLAQQWEQYGLRSADLAAYRQAAGAWEINQPLDHQSVRRLNDQGMYVGFLWDQHITSTLEMSLLVAQTPQLGRQKPRDVATLAVDLDPQRFQWRP